jgi:hypothetical protein
MVSEASVAAETLVWRYFKFDRFLDMLDHHKLWFSRPFAFDDPWDGCYPPSYIRRTREYASDSGIPFREFSPELRKRYLRHRYGHFVNCWHMSEHESDAMWRLYAPQKKGVAIQSTVGDLNDCVSAHGSGAVIYYDPGDDVVCPSLFGPHDILFKRNSFSSEREYRIWFDDHELLDRIEAKRRFREQDLTRGQRIYFSNLQQLVTRIIVAPGSSNQFFNKVREACASRQMRWLSRLVECSSLDVSWKALCN